MVTPNATLGRNKKGKRKKNPYHYDKGDDEHLASPKSIVMRFKTKETQNKPKSP